MPDNLLARLPNLKVVSSYGVGYDAIDADDAADRGILVSHTPNVLNDEVADTAIMLWLATSRRLVQADKWARSGQWEREGAFPLTRSVQKRQVGILGMGRIGETIAKRALGLMQPSIITLARRRMLISFITVSQGIGRRS